MRTGLGKLLLSAVAIVVLGAGVSPLVAPAYALGGDHHIIWDELDKMWRCVGSPLNCDQAPT